MRPLAFVTCALLFLSPGACAESADGSGIEFEFAVGREIFKASPDSAGEFQFPRDCVENPDERTVVYSAPSGAIQEFQIDRDAQLRASFVPTKIVLTEYHDDLSMKVVVARAAVRADQLQVASQFRERYGLCTILVSVNGKAVWVDHNGSRWIDAVPAGVYQTEASARADLARGSWPVVWEPWPELERSAKFWQWRRAMDIWEYACKGEIGKAVDAAIPEAAGMLSKELEKVDCSQPPAMDEGGVGP